LLSLLVYLGGLIVLFAYLWMFITFGKPVCFLFPFFYVFLFFLFCSFVPFPSSLSPYLIPTSFLLFLVGMLFWGIVVVVLILDLSQGSFS